MPFSDTLTSVSGRNSRASNVSGATGETRSFRSPPPAMPANNDTLANAGVLSMLKTSTDTGDIGALSFNSSRLPGVSARTQHRKQQISKPTSSASHAHHNHQHHHYAPSTTSRVSSATRDWDNVSTGRQGSFTSMQTMPSNISEAQGAYAYNTQRGPGPAIPVQRHGDTRSQSLTNAQLPRHHSEHSLKSQGYEARGHLAMPPMPENRPPYMYSSRLRRAGYRSPSPALSDGYVQTPPVPAVPVHMVRQPINNMARPPVPPYTLAYSPAEYEQETMMYTTQSVSPVGAVYPPQSQYMYKPTAAPLSPTVPFHTGPQQRVPSHLPQYHQQYGPRRPQPVAMAYQGRMMPQQSQPAGPRPNMAPAAHQMFHNAVRMARQLPQRADTPILEMPVPSSDPPSSGDTVPTASSPPTPQDWTHLQVGIDPAYIDPALTDLPESASDPVIPARYFDYIDGLERVIDESEMESPRPMAPQSGFVQRVKAMLESRSAIESKPSDESRMVKHEDVINKRITIIEEFQAPAELPASPVRIAELEATVPSTRSISHLTRELVKAELGSTTEGEETLPQPVDNVMIRSRSDLQGSSGEPRPAVSPIPDDETLQNSSELPSSPPLQIKQRTEAEQSSIASSSKFSSQEVVQCDSAAGEDTTVNLGETETESQNRFILDADTITVQHQVIKETAFRSQSSAVREAISPLNMTDFTRYQHSEVSPLQTHITDLHSVLHAATTTRPDVEKKEAPPGPSTPRTPRTHSRSVDVSDNGGMPSNLPGNRLSLPADLTQYTSSTMDTSTDAMTDVAVRFSIPQATLSVHKPHIIQITPSSSPALADERQQSHSRQHSIDNKVKRSTVVIDDKIIPTTNHVSSMAKKHHHTKSSNSLSRATRKIEDIARASHDQDDELPDRDDSFDIRVPTAMVVRSKYLGPHLSDLKEESIEDISLRDPKRSMELTRTNQFQLPARIAAVKAMQERKQQEQEERAKLREAGHLRIHEQAGRPLAELRDLPSLNFSRTDLIDQLNEALHVRTMKSAEILRRRDLSPIYCPSPQRPQSTEPLRERYMSFFDRPEDFPSEIASDNDDAEATEILDPSPDQTAIEIRPLSAEGYLLNVASQVNRLSIPSVAGLSERLAELLPSLKHLHLGNILGTDGDVAQTIEDIHNLGQIPRTPRPDTVLTNRTSAGFRTLAERADEIVRNGTHDSILPGSNVLRLNKELPDIPASASADKISSLLNDGKTSQLSNSASAPSDLGKAPVRPSSALVRYRPPSSQEEVRQLLPPEMNPLSRASKRSMMSGSKLTIDLSIPSKTHNRESVISILSRERGTRSLDLTTTGTAFSNNGIDSTIAEGNLTSSATSEQLTGVSKTSLAKHAKRSVLGSIKCRLTRTHDPEHPSRKTLSVTRSVSEDHPHDPGDRYPTTALSPPAAYNIDEVYSHFSDDSSERERQNAAKGRRWTTLKHKHRIAVPRQPTQQEEERLPSLTGDATSESLAIEHGIVVHHRHHRRPGTHSAAHTIPVPVGMGKAEFHIKRFGEKVRNLLAKGGELLRSLSTRSRTYRPRPAAGPGALRNQWLEDSLYSGV